MSTRQACTEVVGKAPKSSLPLDGIMTKTTLRRASDLLTERRQVTREAPHPTAVSPLDDLLGGGLHRGALVELVGRASCGRFAAVLSSLAAATDTGETVALIDLGHHLDPQAAAAAGADLQRVLWVRPRRLGGALAATEALIQAGFPLVVLDLGLPPIRGRVGTAAWLRLARSAMLHRASVLVAAPYRVSGCAAETVVVAERGRGLWSGAAGISRVLTGLSSHLGIAKCRGRHAGGEAVARFTVPEAISKAETAPTTGKSSLSTPKEVQHA